MKPLVAASLLSAKCTVKNRDRREPGRDHDVLTGLITRKRPIMEWNPSYSIVLTLGIGVALVALVVIAAALRMRPLAFASMTALVLVAAGFAYMQYAGNQAPGVTSGQDSTAPRSRQPAGESAVGRNGPAGGPQDARARAITHTESPTDISDEQRMKIRDYLARQHPKKMDRVGFSIVIGSSVPREVKLEDLPVEIADVLNGYNGDQYLIVGDQLVVVDRQSRSISAIVPGIG